MKNKKAMPHITLEKSKGSADLYFEFLDPEERQEFFEDLTDSKQPEIELPDFGTVEDVQIKNPEVKELSINDLSKQTEDFIRQFVKKKRPSRPFLEYDEKHHKFLLKPKYDLEKIIKDVVKQK